MNDQSANPAHDNTSESQPNVENRTLFLGDNLEFLRGINTGTIHLIATDPPFEKSQDSQSTPDSLTKGAKFANRWSWKEDADRGWLDNIKDDWPGVWELIIAARKVWGDEMAAYLCWLGARLMEMHRVLRDDGSLYLHIDQTAHAYMKVLLDAIFGQENFRNEIIWCYEGIPSETGKFKTMHDIILYYSKGSNPIFNILYAEPNGSSQDKSPMRDCWDDIDNQQSLTNKKHTYFPIQKPVELYKRIILASSNQGDFVLDPFCGCATTLIAAEETERQWIGMDIWEQAHKFALECFREKGFKVSNDMGNRSFNGQLNFAYEKIICKTEPPVRTDSGEVATEAFESGTQRQLEPWERLSHKQMRKILNKVQKVSGNDENIKICCAGCGRELEKEFMSLDHILPKSDGGKNFISNRVLLCIPCNGIKGNQLTISGLWDENVQVGWMKDRKKAEKIYKKAKKKVEKIIEDCDSGGCEENQ